MNDKPQSNYRWYMLALATSTVIFAVNIPTMAMPVLFAEIADDLQLNLVQIGAVWGMLSLAAAFVMPISGILGDRFGIKRVVFLSCFIGGITIALIGVSINFVTLMVTVFSSGILIAAVPIHMHKITGFWFQGKQLGMANGIIAAGMGVGFTISSMFITHVLFLIALHAIGDFV